MSESVGHLPGAKNTTRVITRTDQPQLVVFLQNLPAKFKLVMVQVERTTINKGRKFKLFIPNIIYLIY